MADEKQATPDSVKKRPALHLLRPDMTDAELQAVCDAINAQRDASEATPRKPPPH
jgi:hypothetical protein